MIYAYVCFFFNIETRASNGFASSSHVRLPKENFHQLREMTSTSNSEAKLALLMKSNNQVYRLGA